MATDMTLKLDKIEGESLKDGHANEIDVLSYSWGATQSGTAHVGLGSTAGQANVQDLTITKYVDKSTPLLFSHLMTGSHIAKAELFVRKAGGKPLDYLVFTLEQVLVTAVSSGAGGGDDRVQETISMNFSKVQIKYTPQNKDGSGLGPIIKTFNVATGKEE